MRTILNIIFSCILVISDGNSQTIIYRDIVSGGITGAGYSSGISNSSINANINVDLNSATNIKKAFLIFYSYNVPDNVVINFGGESYLASQNSKVTADWNANVSGSQKTSIHVIDVTSSVSPMQNSYSLMVPNQDALKRYACFYLIVVYESVSLKNTNIELLINNQHLSDETTYDFLNLNPIFINDHVGLALQTDILWDTITDGSSIVVNGNNLGIIGGSDSNNPLESGSGVKGHFNYNNGILFGLDDDTSDPIYSGSDGLAIINSTLIGLNQIELKLVSQNTPMIFNSYISFPLVYTTLCDTFSISIPNDTTLCQGSTLQLNASGGQSYEWLPATGLSCSNCPNPIFTADSSMLYTVRIWNNDSCSVVRPLKINVRPKPTFGTITTMSSECGASTGSANLLASPNNGVVLNWQEVSGVTQTSNLFQNLSTGNHTFFFLDTNGCQSADTTIFIDEINSTIAGFSVSPQSGAVPLTVDITNTSQNATNYEWFLDGVSQGSSFGSTVFALSGNYDIMLVAWENSVLCADTAWQTIFVYDSLIVNIPNVFTPNGDGINDFFSITANQNVSYELIILNRWGNTVFEENSTLFAGITKNIWDASTSSAPVTDGVYFVKLNITSENGEVVEMEDFVTVVR